jgi:hypothetical protein
MPHIWLHYAIFLCAVWVCVFAESTNCRNLGVEPIENSIPPSFRLDKKKPITQNLILKINLQILSRCVHTHKSFSAALCCSSICRVYRGSRRNRRKRTAHFTISHAIKQKSTRNKFIVSSNNISLCKFSRFSFLCIHHLFIFWATQ